MALFDRAVSEADYSRHLTCIRNDDVSSFRVGISNVPEVHSLKRLAFLIFGLKRRGVCVAAVDNQGDCWSSFVLCPVKFFDYFLMNLSLQIGVHRIII